MSFVLFFCVNSFLTRVAFIFINFVLFIFCWVVFKLIYNNTSFELPFHNSWFFCHESSHLMFASYQLTTLALQETKKNIPKNHKRPKIINKQTSNSLLPQDHCPTPTMISTWPEIQKTAQYFTDTLLVHSETSVSNGCTYYASKSKTDLSANFPRTFRARPRQIPLSEEQREKFKKEFERQLWLKLLAKDNWRTDQPEYGRGYRCISLRLLHKRAQLFDRFEKIDNKTTVSKKKSEIFNLMTDNKLEIDTTCNRLENGDKGWDNMDKYDKHEKYENSGTYGNSRLDSSKLDSSYNDFENSKTDFSVCSSLVSSRSNSFGLIDLNNLPKLQIHDLGTRVYIDPIIITTFINSIDKNISKLDKSRQYVEILRYIDETVIDGKHEMMLWLDPGLVEIQHVWLEQRDMQTGNPNSSREEHPRMKNEVIYRSKGNISTTGNKNSSVNHIVNSSVNSSYTHSNYGIKILKQNSQTSSQDQDRNSNTTHFNKNCKLKFTEQVRNAPDELLRKCSS